MSLPRILVVDDAPDMLELINAMLPDNAFDVAGASDGTTALRMVSEDPPALIVLDISMPGMDGVSVCRRLKENAPTRGVPVLILTAHSEFEARAKCEDAHADGFLTKPFRPFTLVRTIEHLLEVAAGRRHEPSTG
jgi:CheY-like chemotaxis protein